MAKQPLPQERKSDLVPQDAELEAKVDEFMAPEKVIESDDGIGSAPKLDADGTKQPVKIHVATGAPLINDEIEKMNAELSKNADQPIQLPAETTQGQDATPDEVVTAQDDTVDEVVTVQDAINSATEDELPDDLNDEQIDQAVHEIVANESDELLAVQDEGTIAAAGAVNRRSFKQSLGDWFRKPATRWSILIGLVLLLIAAAVVPTSRYYALNTFGARASASIKIIDQSTQQPLKNVAVSLAGQSAFTNIEGVASLKDIKLGPATVTINKRAFAPEKRDITVGWGSNPLNEIKLNPAGGQFAFKLTDFLSGQPIIKAEVTIGDASAVSDKAGLAKVSLDKTGDGDLKATVISKGYRTETIVLNALSKADNSLTLVPNRKEVFVSKRSGKFDLYKVDIDGKNEQLVLAGSGSERDDISIMSSPDDDDERVAMVSSRDTKRNADGYLLSSLYVIGLVGNTKQLVTQSEQVQLIGWFGSRLVYVQVASGASAANPQRQRLISYDYETNTSTQIAASNYFNDVLEVSGRIYYAPSDFNRANASTDLISVRPDGSDKQTALDRQAWNIFRTDYDKLVFALPDEWYDYTISSKMTKKLDGQPSNLTSRLYLDSPNGKQSLWLDNRDGKSVLIAYDTTTKKDKILLSKAGIKLPLRWISDDAVIIRVADSQQSADFGLSLSGGEPKKIRDVTDTNNNSNWYYY